MQISMNIEELIKKFTEDIRNCDEKLINPPAQEEEINKLRDIFDCLPEELIHLLRSFNGENQSKWEPVNGQAFFMSIEEIIENYNLLIEVNGEEPAFPGDYPKEVKPFLYHEKWVPFMSFDSDIYFLDMDPTESGNIGQIFLINVGQGCDVCEFVSNSINELIEPRITHGSTYA